MDKYTFGNSKAAINLIRTLDELGDVKLQRGVSSVLSKYATAMAQIMFIPSKTTREAILQLWLAKVSALIEDSPWPEIIKTHVRCVAVGLYRAYLKK